MNTSSRMMSFGEEQKIHISKYVKLSLIINYNNVCFVTQHYFPRATADLLPSAYEKEERGKIEVKGKGEMTTFWLTNKSGRTAPLKEEVSSYNGFKQIMRYYLATKY